MDEKRSVIIIGTAYPFRGGGISTFNERLAKAFIDHGDKVVIHTFKLQYPSFLFPGKTQYSKEAPPEGLDIKISINSINPFNWISIGRKLRKLKPDLVVIRYWIPFMAPCFGTIARIIRKNKHSRIISIADNIIPHEKMTGGKLLSSYFIKAIQGFVVMSRSVLADLERFDQKIPRRYCPHPLYDNFGEIIPKEEAKELLQLDPATKYILFFGFIRDYKGLDILIKAFSDERLRQFPVKVLVVGEFYADPKPYLDLILELHMENHIIIKGDFIPNTDVFKYFCASDLVVQPYKNATQSGVTQIAYHFNRPMVTTRVGGLSETVPDGKVGYVVDVDPRQVADAIYRFFLMNKEEEFAENVREEKKKYSWERLISEIDSLFREISS
jgi:glycosyltransferase involved in cell wall biosynthesis